MTLVLRGKKTQTTGHLLSISARLYNAVIRINIAQTWKTIRSKSKYQSQQAFRQKIENVPKCIDIGSICIDVEPICIVVGSICIDVESKCIVVGSICIDVGPKCIVVGSICVDVG